jgi:hypothetical protein
MNSAPSSTVIPVTVEGITGLLGGKSSAGDEALLTMYLGFFLRDPPIPLKHGLFRLAEFWLTPDMDGVASVSLFISLASCTFCNVFASLKLEVNNKNFCRICFTLKKLCN